MEHELVRFVCRTAYEDLKPQPLATIKNQVLTVLGTTIAGSTGSAMSFLIGKDVDAFGSRRHPIAAAK